MLIMPGAHETILLGLMLRCSSVTLAPTSKRPSKVLVTYQEKGILGMIHLPFNVHSVTREYIFFSLNIRFHSQKYVSTKVKWIATALSVSIGKIKSVDRDISVC